MRLTLHTVICCCLFTTVLPLVRGATGELNTSLKKRFRVWLQSRMKRDLHHSVVTSDERCSDIHAGHQQDENAKTDSSETSFGLNIRHRRSTSGCVLMTCAYNDLLHRLHQMSNNKQKEVNAPGKYIGSNGYGRRRRRRSLQDVTQLALQTGRHRRSTEAGQRVHRHKSTRTVA